MSKDKRKLTANMNGKIKLSGPARERPRLIPGGSAFDASPTATAKIMRQRSKNAAIRIENGSTPAEEWDLLHFCHKMARGLYYFRDILMQQIPTAELREGEFLTEGLLHAEAFLRSVGESIDDACTPVESAFLRQSYLLDRGLKLASEGRFRSVNP